MMSWEQIEATANDAMRLARDASDRATAEWRDAAAVHFATRDVYDSLAALREIVGPNAVSPREDLRYLASNIAARALIRAKELPLVRGVE